jgi:hypothetical protein
MRGSSAYIGSLKFDIYSYSHQFKICPFYQTISFEHLRKTLEWNSYIKKYRFLLPIF